MAAPDSIRLTTVGDSLRYIFTFGKKQFAVNAETGVLITEVTPQDAVYSATRYLASTGNYQVTINEDAWTHSRALDPHRPLHVVEMADADNTWLYISGATGEVVRDATQTERQWNWIGAWLHWLYPFRGNIFQPYAANIVIYSALGGSILAFSGIVIGFLRWRFVGRYKSGSHSPYRRKSMRWHHITGLVFGLTTFTWILSGLFSVNPWKLFDANSSITMQAYKGTLNNDSFTLPIATALTRLYANGFAAVEIECQLINGQGYFIGYDKNNTTKIVVADANATVFDQFDTALLLNAAQQLFRSQTIVKQEMLYTYDFFYYSRQKHSMSGHLEKRLPVIRLVFDDPLQTWIQIDPHTGHFTKLDAYKRTSRVLFNFLHSWDWLVLLNNRPVWDILIILFSAGGLALSITGTLIGIRRLKSDLHKV
jgi:uncharacterized iron-regulated membrane protein